MIERSYEPAAHDFPDGTAIVIAGAGFVGKEVCLRLAECGSDVALTYFGNEAGARAVAEEVEKFGVKARVVQLDITDTQAVQSAIDGIAAQTPVHSLIVASGADIRLAYFSEIEPAEWLDAIHVDTFGFYNLMRAILPVFRDRGGGAIVGVTSAAVERYSPKDVLSTAPKAAVEATVRAIAREEGRYNIRANTVGIGVLDGGITGRFWPTLSPSFQEKMRNGNPLRRMGHPREVANVAVFLASEKASYVTGQRLIADGGFCV